MEKPTIQQVRDFIRHANAEELRLVSSIIQTRFAHLQAEVSMTFSRGEKVWFVKGKRDPRRITGEVVHSDARWVYLNVSGYPVGTGGWNWKVGPTMLRREEVKKP